MNSLEQYIHKKGIDPCDAMNLLQGEYRLVSDLCITPADVAKEDVPNSLAMLKYLHENNLI